MKKTEIKPKTKREQGMALLMVLSSIAIITVAGVEFAYNTNVASHLASNERDRLQSYYLAKSALNLMLLELKYDRVFRQVVTNQNLGQFLKEKANLPLCQQFPLSTSLIRMVFVGGGGGEEGRQEAVPETSEAIEGAQAAASLGQEAEAKAFLDFEGDFEGECIDESTKFNLNVFANLNPEERTIVEGKQNLYTQFKQELLKILKHPKYTTLFELSETTPEEAVRNIADWVDTNEQINDRDGSTSGSEHSLYERMGVPYKTKSDKFLSPQEIHLVAGVNDDWFSPMKDLFTIYGDGKINICSANDDLVKAIIQTYIEATPGLPPVRLHDTEVMDRLTAAVTEACTSGGVGDQIVDAVESKLRAALTAAEGETPSPEGVPNQAPGAAQFSTGLNSFVTANSRYFTLNLTGRAGDTTTKISVVVNTEDSDPKRWSFLYWKVY
ncbi:MAG: general secretion pathway protein GspK [Deltaproteobacteria bacterium]|nr:general secretion pathway protein GspK [Deltaproteobacteria bacterium]